MPAGLRSKTMSQSMIATPIDKANTIWYIINLHPHIHMSQDNEIKTENEFTTNPKMLELTSNAGKLKYSYLVQTIKSDGSLYQFAYSTAMNALNAVLAEVRYSSTNVEVEIIKVITNRNDLYVETEKMSSVELQNEAFMESNLVINKAVPFGSV